MSCKISNFCSGVNFRRTFFASCFSSMSFPSSLERLTFLPQFCLISKKTGRLACPQADRAKLQDLKKLRAATDSFALAKTIEQKLERIYQLANHRVSPNPEPPQPSLPPLTRAERQAVLEISELLGIQVRGETQKTTQRRVTS